MTQAFQTTTQYQ